MADRGLCSYAHLALLVQAGVHAVLRVWARQMVDFTPGRPFVMPGVRRTPAVKGLPRSRWLQTLGFHDQLVTWLTPKTCPSWLTREALAALPEALVLREVRDHLGMPGFRTRQMTLVTTLPDAKVYGVADLAEWYRLRWQVEVCQTQPVKMSWYPLRHAPRTISDLRGFVKREYVIDINLRARHHDLADQAVSHRLTLFKRELVQIVTQQAPKGFGMLTNLLPMARLLLGAGSWLAFLLDLLHLCGEFQPPSLSFAQTDNLGLIRVQ